MRYAIDCSLLRALCCGEQGSCAPGGCAAWPTPANEAVHVQGTTVENWVQHGLGLPQYREAFVDNGVSVLDFPLFLEDEALLTEDLGIRNRLHRQQIIRAMRSLVFGIGHRPAALMGVSHRAAEGQRGTTIVWEHPAEARRRARDAVTAVVRV